MRLEELDDDAVLALRFRDLPPLGVRIEGSRIAPLVERVQRELDGAGIVFRPHAWLSTDWFSPDGVPGYALPFYLAHPRLVRLERARVLFVEGGREREALQLIRHEVGHALDTAFALHRRPEWRAAFGRRSQAYTRSYTVDPASTDHVRHLPNWYAQSHPAEDFAETFAVWLDARSRWRDAYARGGAREKLELVDALMREVRGAPPAVRRRERTEAIERERETLAEHYRRKRRRLRREPAPPFHDALSACFEPGRASARSSGGAFVRGHAGAIARKVRGRCSGDAYSIEQVLSSMVRRCKELGLRVSGAAGAPTRTRRMVSALAEGVEATHAALASGDHALHR